jgi:hypothetical protein
MKSLSPHTEPLFKTLYDVRKKKRATTASVVDAVLSQQQDS